MAEPARSQSCKASTRGYCPAGRDCSARHPPACRFGQNCTHLDCKFMHDVDICNFGLKCDRFGCNRRHPQARRRDCTEGADCSNASCGLRHPSRQPARAGPRESGQPPRGLCKLDMKCTDMDCKYHYGNTICKLREKCDTFGCPLRHSRERTPECSFGANCNNQNCQYLHPASRLAPHIPQQRDKPESPARHSLESSGTVQDVETTLMRLLESQYRSRTGAIMVIPALYYLYKEVQYFTSQLLKKVIADLFSQNSSAPVEAQHPKDRQRLKALLATKQELISQRHAICATVLNLISRDKHKPKSRESYHANLRIKREILRLRTHLPILATRLQIEEILCKNHQFLVVRGRAGSGKSSQLPQYLADMNIFDGKKIICTQPRALAAIGLAERVAFEYAAAGDKRVMISPVNQVGGLVGFNAGSSNQRLSSKTRIEFTTEATLLYSLDEIDLNRVGAIIIDEADERNLNTDLLLGILKTVAARYAHLRIIVTSSAANADLLARYLHNCPVVEIRSQLFPIDVVFKPARQQQQQPREDTENNAIVSNVLQCVLDILRTTRSSEFGDILCFLPSQEEVERATQSLKQLAAKNQFLRERLGVFPLFADQSHEKQDELFARAPKGCRKVIFSTDIAETAVTVDGVRFVVDSGFSKDSFFDPNTKLTTFKVFPITKASAMQRSSRAGRAAPGGTCYRLYRREDFDEMAEESKPEILRRPLNQTFASLMCLDIDPVRFDWIQAPHPDVLADAEQELTIIGAISSNPKPLLTEMGRGIAALKADPSIVSMLYYACNAGLGETGCILAGLMGVASHIFWRGHDAATRAASDNARSRFSNPKGDHVSLFRVYQEWLDQVATAISESSPSVAVDDEADNFGEDELISGLADAAAMLPTSEASSEVGDDADDSILNEEDSETRSVAEISDLGVESLTGSTSETAEESEAALLHRPNSAAAQSATVRNWCKANFINNKMLIVANDAARDLKRVLVRIGWWKLQPQQDRPATDDQVQRLVARALLFNVALQQKDRKFKAASAPVVGFLHPSCALFQQGVIENARIIVYQNVIRTSIVTLSLVTPVELAWFDEFPAIRERIEQNQLEEVRFNRLPQSTLQTLLGKFNSNLDALSRELGGGTVLDADLDTGTLVAYCNPAMKTEVKRILQTKVDSIKKQLEEEIVIEPFLGSTRIAWGAGFKPLSLFASDQFISFNMKLPDSWSLDMLRAMLLRQYGPLCAIRLLTRDQAQWVQVTFVNPDDAKVAFLDMVHNKLEAVRTDNIESVQIAAADNNGRDGGGAERGSRSLFKEIRSQLIISWSVSESKQSAILTFNSAADANAFLRSGIFSKVYARGYDPTQSVDPKDRAAKKPDSSLPLQRGKLFVEEEDSKHRSFTTTVKHVDRYVDEVEILRRLRICNLPIPFLCAIYRDKAPETDEAELERLKHMLIPEAVSNSALSKFAYVDEKRGRASIILNFRSSEELGRILLETDLASKIAQLPPRCGQPIRLEERYSLYFSIYESLWNHYESDIERIIKSAKVGGVRVQSIEKVASQQLVAMQFQASDTMLLYNLKNNLESIMQCVIFKHSRKDLLFTSYGRERLMKLLKEHPHIHLNYRNSMIRVYGTEALRRVGVTALEKLIAELSPLKLDERIVILKPYIDQAKGEIARLKASCSLLHLKMGGRCLFASGADESLHALKLKIQKWIFSKKNKVPTEGDCAICYCPLADAGMEPFTFQACGHTFCRECIGLFFDQLVLPIPVGCPLSCGAPAVVRDILAVASVESIEKLKETAGYSFVNQHPDRYCECVKPGCPSILHLTEVPTQKEEVELGGHVGFCEACDVNYCVPCSKFLQDAIKSHSGYTCSDFRKRPSIGQRMRFIQNELLPNFCPRPTCRKPFDTFDGCCAVTCECNCRFCGFCFVDASPDAHPHVRQCALNPTKGNYFASAPEIKAAQGKTKKIKILAYFKEIPNKDERIELLKVIQRDFADLLIDIKESEIV